MKFSLEWLKYFLETEASAVEIAAALNRIGIEVEGLEDPADKLAGFRIAEVLTAKPHPDADKLQVLTVNTGQGEPLQVVCGAPNARAGMKGVLGLPGAVVPANGMELLGSGMVNRRVIEMSGLDPDEWQGFAFGVGVDRLAMLKYGMDDLRAFFDGDVRWLRHYGFSPFDQPTLSGGVGARA